MESKKALILSLVLALVLVSGCLCCCGPGGGSSYGYSRDAYDRDYYYGSSVDDMQAQGVTKDNV